MELFGLRERLYDLNGYKWKIYESLCMMWLIKFNKL